VNNCIGFDNYKLFMLFLCYAYSYCILVGEAIIRYLFFRQRPRDSPVFAVSLLGLIVLVLFAFLSSLFW